nr:hypothetical protein [Tanacetum cinerariifolium]
MMLFSLLAETMTDLGEIIYTYLMTRLLDTPRKKYVSYPRFISCVLDHLLITDYAQFITLRGNKQLTDMGFPSTIDEDICTSSLLSEAQPINPKDLKGNKQPTDKGLSSTSPKDSTLKSKLFHEGKTIPIHNQKVTSAEEQPCHIESSQPESPTPADSHPKSSKVLPPKTIEEILARERERKTRTTLLMAILEDHLAKFHIMTDAKEMWEAIKSRFGGNDESKKMQKYLLKQQFESFSASNLEGLHKGYDRFQSLLSQLETHGTGVSTEDSNQKFLRSPPSFWSQVSLIMRAKPRVDTISFDDLYNNLRVLESDAKGESCILMPRNLLALTRAKLSASIATIHDTLLESADQKGIQTVEGEMQETLDTRQRTMERELQNMMNIKLWFTIDGEGVDWTGHAKDDTEDCSHTEVTSCSKVCKKSYAKLKKLYDEQKEQLGDASIEIQAYTLALKKVEAQLVCYQKNQLAYEEKIRFMKIDLDYKTNVLIYHKKLLAEAEREKEELKIKLENSQISSEGLSKMLNSQMSAKDKSGLGYGSQIHDEVLSYKNEVFESVFDSRSSDVEDSPMNDRFAKVEGMHAVPSPMKGNYMPPKFDFGIDESKFTYGSKQSTTSESDAKTIDLDSCESSSSKETLKTVPKPVESKPKVVNEPKVWFDAPIIEEYESDGDDEYVSKASVEQEKPSCAFINTVKHPTTAENKANKTAGPKETNNSAGAARASSTNYVNTASTQVNDASTPLNTASTPTNQDDSQIPSLEDIYEVLRDGIFTSASYDDDGAVIEPKKISQALEDESWVDVMQEELLQFKTQQVWILVDLTFGKKVIRTKWVYRNKKDKRGVVVRNKASTFLYGKIDEEVYVSQPPGFIDPKFQNKVYKLVKDMYGLHQAPRAWYATLSTFLVQGGYRRGLIDKTLFIKKDKKDIMLVQVYVDDIIFGSTKKSWCDEFKALMKNMFRMSSMGELSFFLGLKVKQKEDGSFISQDKYVAEILKKFDFLCVKTASIPVETKKSLVTPKTLHLQAVKRNFRYLKGQPKLGRWYPKESLFDLEAYSDSDYAGSNFDRKSITEGCQFLGMRLISWQCKKQTIVATLTTEVKYVAAASCCGQVLWIHNQM